MAERGGSVEEKKTLYESGVFPARRFLMEQPLGRLGIQIPSMRKFTPRNIEKNIWKSEDFLGAATKI